ncbi:MAG: hypothetical protein M0Q14_08920 [Tissierellaceae bacterium]|nr:hypothetical protein [Tissierellaceae bacterium]
MKRYFKIIIIEFLIVLILATLFIYRKGQLNIALKSTSIVATNSQMQEIPIKNSKLYLELETALLNGDDEVDLKNLNFFKKPQEIFYMLEMISNDNPEIMYYKGAEYRLGKLNLLYTKSKKEIVSHRQRVREIKEDFIKNYINETMSDYEKVLVVHDYIVNSSKYDESLLYDSQIPPESYSSYGVLELGNAVCEGYAKAMKYLLDDLQINSMIVIGASKGENHAWNLVELESEYYHIDATWDDPITENGRSIIRHSYFNLDDEELSKTHNWNRDDYPKANGKKYNYFVYNNLIISQPGELEGKLKDAILRKDKNLCLKLKDFEKNININRIVEKVAYENYNITKLRSYGYSIDVEQDILNFEFYY